MQSCRCYVYHYLSVSHHLRTFAAPSSLRGVCVFASLYVSLRNVANCKASVAIWQSKRPQLPHIPARTQIEWHRQKYFIAQTYKCHRVLCHSYRSHTHPQRARDERATSENSKYATQTSLRPIQLLVILKTHIGWHLSAARCENVYAYIWHGHSTRAPWSERHTCIATKCSQFWRYSGCNRCLLLLLLLRTQRSLSLTSGVAGQWKCANNSYLVGIHITHTTHTALAFATPAPPPANPPPPHTPCEQEPNAIERAKTWNEHGRRHSPFPWLLISKHFYVRDARMQYAENKMRSSCVCCYSPPPKHRALLHAAQENGKVFTTNAFWIFFISSSFLLF